MAESQSRERIRLEAVERNLTSLSTKTGEAIESLKARVAAQDARLGTQECILRATEHDLLELAHATQDVFDVFMLRTDRLERRLAALEERRGPP